MMNETTSTIRQEFKVYIESHRQRVHKLGLILFDKFKNDLPNIPRKLVSDFLNLHDLAKFSPDSFTALSSHFGNSLNTLKNDEKFQLQNLINKINENDRATSLSFFKENNLLLPNNKLSKTALLLLKIEKIADTVDRANDPIAHKDFGRNLEPASAFLSNSEEKFLAQFLEQNYIEFTQGISFNSLVG